MNEEVKDLMKRLESSYRQEEHHTKLRLDTFNHLGGPVCVCCGYDKLDALVVDHIKNDGKQDRESVNGNTYSLFRRILRMKPENAKRRYQVLCRNCNWLKEVERQKEDLELRRKVIRKEILGYGYMAEHYRRLELPFGLDP